MVRNQDVPTFSVNTIYSVRNLCYLIRGLDFRRVRQHYSCCFYFVLRFYDPVNPLGSCRDRSVYVSTRLLDRLSLVSG